MAGLFSSFGAFWLRCVCPNSLQSRTHLLRWWRSSVWNPETFCINILFLQKNKKRKEILTHHWLNQRGGFKYYSKLQTNKVTEGERQDDLLQPLSQRLLALAHMIKFSSLLLHRWVTPKHLTHAKKTLKVTFKLHSKHMWCGRVWF